MRISLIFCITGLVCGLLFGTIHIQSLTMLSKLSSVSPTEIRNTQLALNWAQIESNDYNQLACKLRFVACPPQTINGIVSFRVTQAYNARINTLEDSLKKYWASEEDLEILQKKKESIRKELSATLVALGVESPAKIAPKTPLFTDQLPEAKREKIAFIIKKYPFAYDMMDVTQEEKAVYYNNRKARQEYLRQVLNPEELTNYRLEKDSNFQTVVAYTRLMNLTDAELKKIAFIFDFTECRITMGRFNDEVEKAILEALGEERYRQFLELYKPENIMFTRLASVANVTWDEINKLKQLQNQNLPPNVMKKHVEDFFGQNSAGRRKAFWYFSIFRLSQSRRMPMQEITRPIPPPL